MFIPVLLFLVGLVLLISGGDWFVDGATGIARHFRIPDLLIGATVVSIGTTLPEVMVSATSAISGHGEIAYGNAIGSIICNTSLIAAITIAVRPGKVERKSLTAPVLFFFTAAAMYAFTAYTSGYFSRTFGILLLAVFVIYMVYTVLQMKNAPQSSLAAAPTTAAGQSAAANSRSSAAGSCTAPAAAGSTEDDTKISAASLPDDSEDDASRSIGKNIFLLVLGAGLIAVGANLLVDNGTLIAQALGVPESVIALTFVALGTSLPELVTAITSLVKGHGSLSLGNVIGANLFNLVLVSGISMTLSPFSLPQGSTIAGHNASLVLDVPLMLFVMLFLTVPALIRGRLSRVQGIVLLLVYAAYCVLQFMM